MMQKTSILALIPFLFSLFSCGDDDKGTSDDAVTGMQFVEVCGATLECGETCVADSSCPDGQFCADDGTCYAECTPTQGCEGSCTANGHCDGTRQVVVKPSGGPQDNGPILVGDDDTPAAGPGDNGEGCAASQANGALTPVTMYVMLDNSISMQQQGKWEAATEAINAFFEDPATGGMKIALRFFDNPDGGDGGCNEQACANDTVSSCGQPDVPLGEVMAQAGDPQEQALVSAVDGQDPDVAGTPLFAALSGATQWATARQSANTNEQVVVLFVTDGEPRQEDTCPRDADAISQIAADALAQGVNTYAIGLEGSNESLMNSVAAAGGTGQGVFIGSDNAEDELLAALTQIRGEAVSCDIQVPTGTGANPDEASVEVTLSSGAMDLARVSTEGDCTDAGGWYFNDNQNPTRLLLCDSTCDAVTNDPAASLAIELGCVTTTIVVPGVR